MFKLDHINIILIETLKCFLYCSEYSRYNQYWSVLALFASKAYCLRTCLVGRYIKLN